MKARFALVFATILTITADVGAAADSNVRYPGDKYRIHGAVVAVHPQEVHLESSWGYIFVQVRERRGGLYLFIEDRATDAKPIRSLQERTVAVELIDGESRQQVKMKNTVGYLYSRRPLRKADSWRFVVRLKGHGNLKDDMFTFEYKKGWIMRSEQSGADQAATGAGGKSEEKKGPKKEAKPRPQ